MKSLRNINKPSNITPKRMGNVRLSFIGRITMNNLAAAIALVLSIGVSVSYAEQLEPNGRP